MMSSAPTQSHPLRRALVIWAFLLAVFLNPILPSLLASDSTMACCRKNSRHACCSRYTKARVPVFQAQPTCSKSCCQRPQFPPTFDFAIEPPATSAARSIVPAQVLIAGTGQTLSSPLPNSLFQRPPPTSLSL